MNKLSITMISLVAMTGLAAAQQKGAGSGSAAAGATVGAGAKVDAKTGAGTATGAATGAAGTATGAAKTGAGAATGAAKTGTGAATGATTGAGANVTAGAGASATTPKMEMPKPPAEIAATVKAMGARKTCTGQGMGMDMQMADMKGTVTSKADLDGWFIRQNINMTLGKGKTSSKMKMEQLLTYDTKLAKWRVVGVSNDGGTVMGTADMKDDKYEFTGDMTGPMGTAMFRDHGDMTDKKNVKWWGEMSMDKGKTWTKVYEQTCK